MGRDQRRARGQPLEHQGEVYAAEFSHDGRLVLTGSADRDGPVVGRHQRPSPLSAATASRPRQSRGLDPDGSFLLTSSEDGTARLWDAASGQPRGQPLEHGAAIWSLALSPDGRTAITGGADGTARLWDTATGQLRLHRLRHRGGIKAIAISRDGKTLLTGSVDKTAQLGIRPVDALAAAPWCMKRKSTLSRSALTDSQR